MTENSEQITKDVVDDVDIVLQLMEREEQGLRLLIRKYGGPVKAFLRSRFGPQLSRDDREDLLSDVVARVWKYINSFDESKGSLGSWLVGIAQNEALDMLARERLPVETLEHDPLDPTDDQDEELTPERRRLFEEMDKIIEELTPRQQEVVREDMRCGGEADGPALAAKLGTSPNAIRVARSKARKIIREKLQALGHEIGGIE